MKNAPVLERSAGFKTGVKTVFKTGAKTEFKAVIEKAINSFWQPAYGLPHR